MFVWGFLAETDFLSNVVQVLKKGSSKGSWHPIDHVPCHRATKQMSISTVKSASLVPAKWHPRFSRFQPRQAAGHIGLYRTYLTEVNGKNGGVLSTLKKWKKMFACQYYPRILAKVVWKNQWFYASINQWRKDETNSRIFTPTAVQFITYFDGATWVKLTIVPRHQYQDWLWDTFFLPLFSSFNVGLASSISGRTSVCDGLQ